MDIHQESIEILKEFQIKQGYFPTFPEEDTVNSNWLKNGTLCAYAMDVWDNHFNADKFYKAADRKLSNQAWNTISLDNFGTYLWGLIHHIDAGQDNSAESLKPSVEKISKYLANHWEQSEEASTLAAIYGGLQAYERLFPGSSLEQILNKIKHTIKLNFTKQSYFINSKTTEEFTPEVLFLVYPFKVFSLKDKTMKNTYLLFKDQYLYDKSIMHAALIALCALSEFDYKGAEEIFFWLQEQTDQAGYLPDKYHVWFDHQDEIIKPMLTSHAMYLILENELKKFIKS